ncbi:MAG: TIGR00725 family protein [Calditrichia bacterium]
MRFSHRISVIGGAEASPEILNDAFLIGKYLAQEGWLVYNGGKGGVMEAVSRGVTEAGGTVVGLLPETDASFANPYISIPVPTGLGVGRNLMLIHAAEVVIAIDGRYGTLSEIAFALQFNKPVVGYRTWDIDKSIRLADSPEEVISLVKGILENNP